jgi:hypothetical protein
MSRQNHGEATLTVRGEIGGTSFESRNTIMVLE